MDVSTELIIKSLDTINKKLDRLSDNLRDCQKVRLQCVKENSKTFLEKKTFFVAVGLVFTALTTVLFI